MQSTRTHHAGNGHACDAEQITKWFDAILAPDQIVEVRGLEVPQRYGRALTMFGYFDSEHRTQMGECAAQMSNDGAMGVYFTINPVHPDLLARAANRVRVAKEKEATSDTHILGRRFLFVDCDSLRLAGISATDAEKEHTRQVMVAIDAYLHELGFPAPIIADSGNGFHLLYLIDIPTDDAGLVERCLHALAKMFDTEHVSIDTKVFNPARIDKVYGTLSGKGDSIPARPHRPSKILNIPDELKPVPIELLEKLAAQAPPATSTQPPPKSNGHAPPQHNHGSVLLDVDAWLHTHNVEILKRDADADGLNRWFISCPGINAHTSANGIKDCVITQEADGRLGGQCFHSSCGMRSWTDIRDAIGKPTRDDYPTTLANNNGSGTHQPHSAPPVNEGGGHSANSSPPRKPTPLLSVRDLIGGFRNMRKPIIYGLLREGETMNIIAASKVGKSWLATNLALTFATRRKWLGRFDTAGGDVLIVDNELHPETSAYRIPAVADANAISLDEYADHVFVMNLRGELVTLPQLAITLDSIEPGRFKLVILDAFYRFLPPGVDENDNGEMAQLYNSLDRVAAKLKCAFVCIHHASKGSQSAKAVTDVGSGAGSMSRAADCHVVLRPHEESNVVVMEAATRSWPPLQPLCLRWEFPIFTEDPTLDPTLLKPDRPKRPARADTVKTPAEPGWTHQRFTKEFCDATPQTRDAILAKAVDGGLAARKADELFKLAEGAGLLFEWPNVVRRKRGFATVQPSQPSAVQPSDDTQKITHTPPPYPPNTKPQKRRVGVGGSECAKKRKAKAFGNRDR